METITIGFWIRLAMMLVLVGLTVWAFSVSVGTLVVTAFLMGWLHGRITERGH